MVLMVNKVIGFIASVLFEEYIGVLRKSNIIFNDKDLSYQVKGDDIVIVVPKSIDYQEAGRRAKAKRVPIKALIAWGLKHKIPNINKYVYAIQTNIYKRGIRPKKVKFDIDKVLLTIDLSPYISDLAKVLSN